MYSQKLKGASLLSYKLKSLILYHPSINLEFLEDILKRGFNKSYKNTIGLDILIAHVKAGSVYVDFSFWDIKMGGRFRFFRNSFYRGTSSVIIFIDLDNQKTIFPFLKETISELYNSIGPVPIFLIGLHSDHSYVNEYIEEVIEEDYIFYFDFENESTFQKEILVYIAKLSLNLIKDSSDIISKRIREQFRKYLDLKQQGIDNYYNTIKEMGLTIVDNNVKILNKYGLFTVDIINGSVIYESLMCENCKNIEKCRKKHVIPKKALCIVSDSFGWDNLFIGQDKLLILSKILAIIEADLPDHVLQQMKQARKCPETFQPISLEPPTSPTPKSCIAPPEIEEPELVVQEGLELVNREDFKPEECEIYLNLTPSEIKQRLRILKTQLWEGRIPASTYIKLEKKLKDYKKDETSPNQAGKSFSMLGELKKIKRMVLTN